MNENIQHYIAERKEEVLFEHEKEKHLILEQLNLGKRVYSDSKKQTSEYPLRDDLGNNNNAYRIDAADDLTEEEYEELRKYAINNEESKKGMSGWYYFAIIMMILGCLGGIYVGSEADNALVAISIILGILIFFSQIILLCKIEYNTRSNK